MTRHASTRRCVTCARTTGGVEYHHVAGDAHLPAVKVPVCRSRHLGAWHRAMRTAGVDLSADGSLRAKLRATAVGFRVVLEDGSALADDPTAARLSIRSRTALSLELIDVALAANERPVLPSRRVNPRPGRGDCAPRSPRTQAERRERTHAFVSGLLPALAALLEALLPAQHDTLDLPGRLRRIDPAALSDAALVRYSDAKPGVEITQQVNSITTDGFRDNLGRDDLLAVLGGALDLCVSELERIARGEAAHRRGCDG